MLKPTVRFLILCVLLVSATARAQVEREIPPPDGDYGTKFFDQLRSIFGRFRDADLQHVFQSAEPIPCSELVDDKGEWRSVAFFNDNRKLGDWYRNNLSEVKEDLAVYIFKGPCRGERGPVQLTTKFPVIESIEQFNARKISFEKIEVNVNAPVSAVFDNRTGAYTFELPYLFRIGEEDGQNIYSLTPQRLAERNRYAPDVTNHWDCKSVRASDVTYQFLICRTTMTPRDVSARNQTRSAFGSSAFFILSDGKEAISNVRFTFGEPGQPPPPEEKPESPEPERRPETKTPQPAAASPAYDAWRPPSASTLLLEALTDEFRLRFDRSVWSGKIDDAATLWGGKMQAGGAPSAKTAADYCVWRPATRGNSDRLLTAEPDASAEYSVKGSDKTRQASTTFAFDVKTHNGLRLGALQCVFSQVEKAEDVTYEQWRSIVGSSIILETRR